MSPTDGGPRQDAQTQQQKPRLFAVRHSNSLSHSPSAPILTAGHSRSPSSFVVRRGVDRVCAQNRGAYLTPLTVRSHHHPRHHHQLPTTDLSSTQIHTYHRCSVLGAVSGISLAISHCTAVLPCLRAPPMAWHCQVVVADDCGQGIDKHRHKKLSTSKKQESLSLSLSPKLPNISQIHLASKKKCLQLHLPVSRPPHNASPLTNAATTVQATAAARRICHKKMIGKIPTPATIIIPKE